MKIQSSVPSFKQTHLQPASNFSNIQPVDSIKKKQSFLDKFYSAAKNSADMTDTIVVPRTIFKGYLGIMTGTTLMTISSLLSSKFPKSSTGISIAGALTAFYGTYAFVRPYVIKDAPGVDKKK